MAPRYVQLATKCSDTELKDDAMGGECGMHWGKEKYMQNFG